MPKTSILHVLALDTMGGVERLFAAYLEGSRETGLQHHVLAVHGRVHPVLKRTVHRNAASVSYGKYAGPLKLPRWPAFLRELNRRAVVRRAAPDLIVLHSGLGRLEHARLGEAVTPPAAMLYYEHGAAWGNHDPEQVGRFLERLDGVLVNSHGSRRMLELRWGLGEGIAEVCYNGARLRTPPEGLLPRALPEAGPVRLGFAGRLVPIKGAVLALHALARLREQSERFELDVAGTGPEEHNLRTTARALGIEDSVRFPGLVSDMASFYRRIHVMVVPSLREPLGNVSIEAAFYGCPVVATRVDGLPEAVLDGRTGVVVPGVLPVEEYAGLGSGVRGLPEVVYDPATDQLRPPLAPRPEALAEAVMEVCADGDAYGEMSARAQQRARDEFSTPAYFARLDRAYLRTAQRRGS
ncbi:MAG: glycosyltransferase family 4 protein [Candidatus Brocadiia bacterium]